MKKADLKNALDAQTPVAFVTFGRAGVSKTRYGENLGMHHRGTITALDQERNVQGDRGWHHTNDDGVQIESDALGPQVVGPQGVILWSEYEAERARLDSEREAAEAAEANLEMTGTELVHGFKGHGFDSESRGAKLFFTHDEASRLLDALGS